jgi:hypothetical protein
MAIQLKKVCLNFFQQEGWIDYYFFVNGVTYKNCHEHNLYTVNKK